MKPPTACYWLDNKQYHFPPPADGRVREAREPVTPFMCLKTHEAFGPDGGEACEGCCSSSERACYKPEVEL